MTITHARCDHIITLIDECLAEVEADVPPTGARRSPTPEGIVRPRHLVAVK